jgi:aryl-alcohol dehydrogenase-like predicted oxidoreductase
MQTRYSLAFREEEREMIPLCADQGVAVLPYSPLARGLLARTPGSGAAATARQATLGSRSSTPDNDDEIVAAVAGVAAERGVAQARVALAWLLAKPAVAAPIVGVTRAEQLDDALAAVDLTLDPSEIARLEAPYRPHRPYGY